MISPPAYVSEIKPYVPGKPIKELEREFGIKGSVKLASNENPIGPSQRALEAIRSCLETGCEIHRYPDGSGYYLKNAIADKLKGKNYKLEADNIILGNGSNELIDIAVRTFMTNGDEAVMGIPSFVVYSMAVRSVGGICKEISLIDYRHDLNAMANAITNKTKMIFIANPNNPTGVSNKRDEFERFMEKVPDGVLVVIDEAYYEYASDKDYPDSLKYFMDGMDILILRTFSKAYGLASLRIGYGIARSDILSEMNKIREPFNTNSIAQIAALHALTDEDHIKKTLEINEIGKKFLYKELDRLDIRYIPTDANFIYMHLDTDSKDIYDALLKMGVIVRPVGPKEIRVTIGLPEENKRFIDALRMLLTHKEN